MAKSSPIENPPIAIALLSIALKLIVGIALLFLFLFLIMPSARWSTAGYVSGRTGSILGPESHPITILVIGNFCLAILSYMTARGLKRRSWWARWMPFSIVIIVAAMILFLKSPVLLAPLCVPLLVLSLLNAFLPSSLSYFSSYSPRPSTNKNFSILLKASPPLLFAVGVLWIVVDGIIDSNRISDLCRQFPVGSSSANFFQDSFNADVDRLGFENQKEHVSKSWSKRVPESRNEITEKYAVLDSGKAYAQNNQFFFFRTSCDIQFEGKKVIQSSIKRFD